MKDTRKLSTLHGWKDNPRNITPKDYERLKLQIQKLGQYKPILVTKDGEIIGGNMRLKAYQELGITDIWVSEVDPKDDNEKLEYALSDNDRAGYYDDDMLANLIPNYDIDWSQYAVDMKPPEDIQKLIERIAPVEEDEAPEVSEGEAGSKLGEVYQLGRHRLMCGDSTKIEDVEKLMDGKKAELLFTSPPYSDMREYKGGKDLGVDNLATFIPTFRVFTDYQVVNLGLQRKGNEIYPYWEEYLKQAKESGYKLLAWNVWSKRDMGGSVANMTAMFPIEHEWLFVFGTDYKELNRTQKNKSAGLHKGITNRQKDGTTKRVQPKEVQDYGKLGSVLEMVYATYEGHPAVFPVGLPQEYIKAMTNENDGVIDCFGGSGSTLIACEQTNRICYMMELDPKYCDVIRKRYAKFVGKEESWEITTPVLK